MEIQDGSNDKKYFTIIPNYILNHSTMWDREVYIQMKRIAGERGTCWTSQKTLAKQCGVSINRLKKSLRYLLEHKWIKEVGTKRVFTAGGNQQVNEYRITDLWDLNNKYYQDKGVSLNDTPIDKGVSPIESKGYHGNTKGVSPSDDKEEPINNITIKEEPLATSLQKNIVDLIDLFKSVNPSYKQFFGNKTERACLTRMLQEHGREKLTELIEVLPKTNSMDFAPVITSPYKLERKLGDLLAFISKEKIKPQRVVKL